MTAFVYLLLDPTDDYIPFYVGKGSHVSWRARNRPKFHLKEALDGVRSAKCEQIRKIIDHGEMYSVLIWQDHLTHDAAYDVEEDLIRRFGRKHYDEDGILTNIVVNNRRIDYSKVVYKRGLDHHSSGVKRAVGAAEKQVATRRMLAQLSGSYSCKCGCDVEVSWNQRNYAAGDRHKHGIADWHLTTLPHNAAKSRKIKLLLRGFSDEQIIPEMYLDKQVFANISGLLP